MHPFIFRSVPFVSRILLCALLLEAIPVWAQKPASLPAASTPWTPPPPVYSATAGVPEPRTPVPPPVFASTLPDTPSAEDLRDSRVLDVPLVKLQRTSLYQANRPRLARVLEAIAQPPSKRASLRSELLLSYLQKEPISDLSPSLWLEVGRNSARTGYFQRATQALKTAWTQIQYAREGTEERAIAETALAELCGLYLKLAQKEPLTELLAQVESRPAHPISSAMLAMAKAQLETWNTRPLESAKCGVTAANLVAAFRKELPVIWYLNPQSVAHAGNHTLAPLGANQPHTIQNPTPEEAEQLIAKGVSASQLLALIQPNHPHWGWIRRTSGQAIPAPCVVHFAFDHGAGHYSAATEATPSQALVNDPFFGFHQWLDIEAVNAIATGFFLIPDMRAIPPGFVAATPEELSLVFGRCVVSANPEGANPEGSQSEEASPDSALSSESDDCGMISGSISKFIPSVQLHDRPLTYRPAFGPALDLSLRFRADDYTGDSILSDTSHLGRGWTHGYLSYIRSADGSPLSQTEAQVQWVTPTTFYQYWMDGSSYVSHYADRPVLSALPSGFKLRFRDGSEMEFTQPNAAAPSGHATIFL